MEGLYVHIPFCRSRCVYCGFYSTTLLPLRQRYVDALCREMRLREKGPLQTIYIGGGTPSLLSPAMLRQLFDSIRATYEVDWPHAEITMECNPDDVTPEFADSLAALPVNRVSMGIQTFSDQRLRFLHRRHDAAQARGAFRHLREAGFSNISIDLMFGFPEETLGEWEADIQEALSLGAEHISAYSLMYEEGTPLHQWLESQKVEEIDEETYILMYETLVRKLTQAGYEHYEISNFALPGHRSRHNSSYWDGTPYIGLGAAAHSYTGIVRQSNLSDVMGYMQSIEKGIVPMEEEELRLMDRYNDMVTTALRTSSGIPLAEVVSRFGQRYQDYLLENAQQALDRGWMRIDEGRLHLTLAGIAVSDMVASDLIMLEDQT